MKKKNVLITGGGGQLAKELARTAPDSINFSALDSKILDISNVRSVEAAFNNTRPDFIINAAAYTAVDKAEIESEQCYRVNELGVRNLALACRKYGSFLLHISTDFVFDGQKGGAYLASDKTSPLSVYGESKAAGEKEVLSLLPESSAIIRTAWVYSVHGDNFVKSMLKLMTERKELSIVCDQIGSPTWGESLAKACWDFLTVARPGIYHWTDAGVASWYDFSVAIYEIGRELKLLNSEVVILPIMSEEYRTQAVRPSQVVLDKSEILKLCSSLKSVHWKSHLRIMMARL